MLLIQIWSQAGGLFHITPGGQWWADTPRNLWPADAESVAEIETDWDRETTYLSGDKAFVGDRRWRIVMKLCTMNNIKCIETKRIVNCIILQ